MKNSNIIPESLEMKTSEIMKLFNMACQDKNGIYEALTEAYLLGYSRGAEHSGKTESLPQ